MHFFWCRTWLWSFILLSSILPTLAVLRNRTIDDLYGDEHTGVLPSYSPQMVFSKGQECSSCLASKMVDVTQAYNGTWTEATNTGSNDLVISFPFNGTAIYVFCIIPDVISGGVTTLADLNFFVDGAYVGNYIHKPENISGVLYHVPVYAKSGLSNTTHTFEIRPQADPSLGNDGHSLVMFDYAIYSYDDGERLLVTNSTTKHKPPIGAIVGGVLGAQVVLVGSLIMLWLRRRNLRRCRVESDGASTVTIDVMESGARTISSPSAPPAYSTIPTVVAKQDVSLAYNSVIPGVKGPL